MKKVLIFVFGVLLMSTAVVWGQIDEVPGVTIAYSRYDSGVYVGSPGILILPDGSYLAKFDEFGPGSAYRVAAVTNVYISKDKGLCWEHLARLEGVFWSTLFMHKGDVYLLGMHKEYGDIVIFRSLDGGKSWTTPKDGKSGLLRTDAQYHTAPMPILIHNGRLWRAVERMGIPDKWGSFEAGMMSAAVDADLLDAASWTYTNFLPVPEGSPIRHWLEGNAVLAPDGKVVDILRTGCLGPVEKAAVLEVSEDGKRISFEEKSGLVDMPGASDKKFTIRYDEKTNRYWSLVNPMLPCDRNDKRVGKIRNALAVVSSEDLRSWKTHKILLYHPDTEKHAFQYPAWVFDGDDIISALRMAHDDQYGGARFHDANYLTFYRIEKFRDMLNEESDMTPPQTE